MSTTWKIEEGSETILVTVWFNNPGGKYTTTKELDAITVDRIRNLPELTILSLMEIDASTLNDKLTAHFARICKDVYKTIVEKKWVHADTGEPFVFDDWIVDDILGDKNKKSAVQILKLLAKGKLGVRELTQLQKYFDDPQKVKEVVA